MSHNFKTITKNKFYKNIGCIIAIKCSTFCFPWKDTDFRNGVHYEVGNTWKAWEKDIFFKILSVEGWLVCAKN